MEKMVIFMKKELILFTLGIFDAQKSQAFDLTSCFMKFKGNVSINTKREIIVDNTERKCVSAFLGGLVVLILCYINTPPIQVDNFSICDVAQDLANGLICVAGMESERGKNKEIIFNL